MADLIDILQKDGATDEFLENTRLELSHDQVYCFTPKGRLIALPQDSTALDFAFALHTDLGLFCSGVKINGEIIDADEVQIDGQADITVNTTNLLVGGTGDLKGNITSDNLDVWGKIEGEVKVNGTLTIQEQGSVSGNIEYHELQIKLGGKISGEMKSLDKIKKISDAKAESLQQKIVKESASNT